MTPTPKKDENFEKIMHDVFRRQEIQVWNSALDAVLEKIEKLIDDWCDSVSVPTTELRNNAKNALRSSIEELKKP